VISRFRDASDNGLRVEKGAVDLREIIEHVDDRGPVIVLTDGVMLYCSNCGHNMSRYRASRLLPFRSGFEGERTIEAASVHVRFIFSFFFSIIFYRIVRSGISFLFNVD
jgi:hypothetical protein